MSSKVRYKMSYLYNDILVVKKSEDVGYKKSARIFVKYDISRHLSKSISSDMIRFIKKGLKNGTK